MRPSTSMYAATPCARCMSYAPIALTWPSEVRERSRIWQTSRYGTAWDDRASSMMCRLMPELRRETAVHRDVPLESRRKIPGLHPERADIIIAGAAILHVFMRELALHEIRVSARGVREGLLVDYLLKHGASSFLQKMSVRA